MPGKLPKRCLHKLTGQAYVGINGRLVYLGEHGSAKSHEAYVRINGRPSWPARRSPSSS